MYTSKEKGDIGLSKIIADLIEKQVSVSLPVSEHLQYDLIAEKNGVCKRVQVRYTQLVDGRIQPKLCTSWANSSGSHTRYRKMEDYDVLAIYCPGTKECYYVSNEELQTMVRSFTLRITEPKTVNGGVVRYAKDYTQYK